MWHSTKAASSTSAPTARCWRRTSISSGSLEPNIEVVAKPVGYDGQFNYAAFSVSPQGAIAYEEGTDRRATS